MKEVYFITGTDTGVGKTHVATKLIQQQASNNKSVLALKPVATGSELDKNSHKLVSDDAKQLLRAVHIQDHYINLTLDDISFYNFEPPVSPHIVNKDIYADTIAKKCIDAIELHNPDVCYIEGAGGFLCPLNDQETFANIALKLDIPIILVVPIKLGCLNHAMLTVESIANKNLKLHSWVANCLDLDNNYIEENINYLKDNIPAEMIARF